MSFYVSFTFLGLLFLKSRAKNVKETKKQHSCLYLRKNRPKYFSNTKLLLCSCYKLSLASRNICIVLYSNKIISAQFSRNLYMKKPIGSIYNNLVPGPREGIFSILKTYHMSSKKSNKESLKTDYFYGMFVCGHYHDQVLWQPHKSSGSIFGDEVLMRRGESILALINSKSIGCHP